MLNAIMENQVVSDLAAHFHRSPCQLNHIHESDAEIFRPATGGPTLAATTDCLSEEIAAGLYRDPYLIGWMAVTSSLSDLAAVGATPSGVLLAETIPPKLPSSELGEIQRGVGDACASSGTWVLGGDTSAGPHLALTTTAIGTVSGSPLSRRGCSVGDIVYATSALGRGNAFGLQQLLLHSPSPLFYRPRARLAESAVISQFATCCMDTSDGGFATLDQLMRLNTLGFDIAADVESILDPESLALVAERGLPAWLLLAGPHGEFELLFTIPAKREAAFLEEARHMDWFPLQIGRVVEEPCVLFPLSDQSMPFATGWIRNLFADVSQSLPEKLEALLAYDTELQKGVICHVNA